MVRFVSILTAANGWRFHIHRETIWIFADMLPFSISPAFPVPSHFAGCSPVELIMLAPFLSAIWSIPISYVPSQSFTMPNSPPEDLAPLSFPRWYITPSSPLTGNDSPQKTCSVKLESVARKTAAAEIDHTKCTCRAEVLLKEDISTAYPPCLSRRILGAEKDSRVVQLYGSSMARGCLPEGGRKGAGLWTRERLRG